MKKLVLSALILISAAICACTTMAASAEEYFSIGMAYFELGKYEEAEKWLNRAKQADKTMLASQYNLGRLAFEMGRHNEAAEIFEDILKKDPDNVLVLRAAAYTRIKTGDIDIAQTHYGKLLELVPENADDGYNHALVLYAMERYDEAEQVLEKYSYSLYDSKDMLLLYARAMNAQNKVEAIDIFSNWLKVNSDPKVRYEYASILEHHELYARAIEEYRTAISEVTSTTNNIKKGDIQFALARVLMIADGENTEGITEMQNAVAEGFSDITAIEELIESGMISGANIDSLKELVSDIRRKQAEQKEEEPPVEEVEENDDDDSETDSESGSQ